MFYFVLLEQQINITILQFYGLLFVDIAIKVLSIQQTTFFYCIIINTNSFFFSIFV